MRPKFDLKSTRAKWHVILEVADALELRKQLDNHQLKGKGCSFKDYFFYQEVLSVAGF
jgi:hypothetical protein